MPAKKIHRGENSTDGLLKGITEVAATVKATMGPRGRNIIIERPYQVPLVTKDGVTVAENITLADGVPQMGASLLIDAARKTADSAGDGTTTAIVLAEAMFNEGIKRMRENISLIKMSEGIENAVNRVEEIIREKFTRSVEDPEELVSVATIASNSDYKTGKIIGEAMDRTGTDGCIIVQEKTGIIADEIEYVNGMQLKAGMTNQYFANVRRGVCEFKNPYVFVCNKLISSAYEIKGLLEFSIKNDTPIVIFAKDFSAEVLQMMVTNRLKQKVSCVAIKIPDYAEFQAEIALDIAAVSGATAITSEMDYDLKKFGTPNGRAWGDYVGQIDSIRSTRTETILVVEKKDERRREAIDERIKQSKEIKEGLDSKRLQEHDKLQRRIASLSGGVAKLMLTAQTASELDQKKARVEDALYAVKAAAEEGIVPGGGIALYCVGNMIKMDLNNISDESERIGWEIVSNAIQEPLNRIALNSDPDVAGVVKNNIKNHVVKVLLDPNKIPDKSHYWHGWDADKNRFGNMYEFKIIDPVKVPITALRNASSEVRMLLNTGGVIEFEQPEDIEKNIIGHDRGVKR